MVMAALLGSMMVAEACSTCGCSATKKTTDMAKKVVKHDGLTTDALKELITAKKDVVILDARSGKYDDGRRIPGAKSLNASTSKKEAKALIPSKDALVVTYCANLKCPASASLAKRLKELGYTNVQEYPYGIEGWADAGNKVKKISKSDT